MRSSRDGDEMGVGYNGTEVETIAQDRSEANGKLFLVAFVKEAFVRRAVEKAMGKSK